MKTRRRDRICQGFERCETGIWPCFILSETEGGKEGMGRHLQGSGHRDNMWSKGKGLLGARVIQRAKLAIIKTPAFRQSLISGHVSPLALNRVS